MNGQYQITELQLDRLNAALNDAKRLAAEKLDLERRDKDNRAALNDIFEEIGLDNKTVPGLSKSVRTSVQIDENAVLAYALDDANFPHAAPLLTVRKDAVGVVIAAAMNDDRLKGVFELDKTGAQKAAREGTHVGLPHGEPQEMAVIALRPQDIVTGEALAAKFTIVPDIEFEAV
jgi:hypothetical protein